MNGVALPDVLHQLMSYFSQNAAMQFLLEQNVQFISSELIIALTLLFTLVLSLARNPEEQHQAWWLSLAGVALALVTLGTHYVLFYAGQPGLSFPVFGGVFTSDLFSVVARIVLLKAFFIVLLMSRGFVRQHMPSIGAEFYLLLLTSLLGCLFLTGATDLVMLFVSFEMIGIPTYILSSFMRYNERSLEAGIKFLIYGAASTAMLLFGFTLVYGVLGGSTYLPNLPFALAGAAQGLSQWLPAALVLILAGLGFKLSAAPFHPWTPDVYEGAPTPITAYLSVVSKLAVFALSFRILLWFNGAQAGDTVALLMTLLAVLSMLVGNVLALHQTNIKRLLAYSTIAHVGYLLLAFVVFTPQTIASLWYYLFAYVAMNLGAFASVVRISDWLDSERIGAYAGLVRKKPLMTLVFSLFLLSLAGIPVTAGFFAKFFLFQSMALSDPRSLWLIGLALLASTVSLYYYLNVIRVMTILPPSPEVEAFHQEPGVRLQVSGLGMALAICLLGTLVIGFAASPLMEMTQSAVQQVSIAQGPQPNSLTAVHSPPY